MAVTDSYTAEEQAPELGAATEQPVKTPSAAAALVKLIETPNIATTLAADELAKIAARVTAEYKIDEESRSDWLVVNEVAMDLAMLMVGEKKTYPFDGAANVKYPLLTTAAYQFQARAYPAIVPGDRLVKCKVNGKDPQGIKAARGDRVSEYTSWQMLDEMPEWEPDTDRLLIILPIVGCAFRKRYWDPSVSRQVSRLVTADRLVVNYRARSLDDVPRITEKMMLYPYEIAERVNDGRFVEFDYANATAVPSKAGEDQDQTDDPDTPHLFLEQHRLWDLDGDGYPEPYIVTVHAGSEQVCRIVANYTVDSVRFTEDGKLVSIRKRDFYVKYGFLPSPDGGFYEMGFGWLLRANNEAINTTLNEMLDAGHLANIQGGFVSSALGQREKEIKIPMGKWKVLQTALPLNQAVMPITYPGPSDTLFKLLGLLVEMGKEVASIKDVLSGETKTNMQPTTVLALIDQGMQFFTAIYKRIHRAFKEELRIHSRLNKENLTPEAYNEFFDDEEQQYDPEADFETVDRDISPASDPSASSKMQKLAKAELLMNWAKENPLANIEEVNRRFLQAADIEDTDQLIQKQEPDPLMQMLGELEGQEKMAGITKMMTEAIKNLADAEAAEEGTQLAAYTAFMQALGAMNGGQPAEGGPGGIPGMEGQPNDAMGALMPPGPMGAEGGGAEVNPVPQPAPVGPDAMGIPAS
jgi:chaperonin GroES